MTTSTEQPDAPRFAERSVRERLADTPSVQRAVLAAAEAARESYGAVTALERDGTGPLGSGESLGSGGPLGPATVSSAAMTHSWVFTGPPGAGRSTAAVALAAALECTSPGEPGCGRCEACRSVFADAHTDVVHIVPQELTIGVDYVRETVIQAAWRQPTVGRWRVVIIEDADRMTPAAADALLKTVEEPQPSTVIVFCAPSIAPGDFSTTLRSRCRHLYVPAPSVEEIVRILQAEEGASEHDARLAVYASLRHVGRARRLVSSEEAQRRRSAVLCLAELIPQGDEAFRAARALARSVENDVKGAFEDADAAERDALERALGMGARGKGVARAKQAGSGALRDLEKTQKRRGTRRKQDLLDLALVDLAGLYRDAYLQHVGSSVAPTHPDYAPVAQEIAAAVPGEGIVACLDAIAECRGFLKANVQYPVALAALVGRLRLAYGVR